MIFSEDGMCVGGSFELQRKTLKRYFFMVYFISDEEEQGGGSLEDPCTHP